MRPFYALVLSISILSPLSVQANCPTLHLQCKDKNGGKIIAEYNIDFGFNFYDLMCESLNWEKARNECLVEKGGVFSRSDIHYGTIITDVNGLIVNLTH